MVVEKEDARVPRWGADNIFVFLSVCSPAPPTYKQGVIIQVFLPHSNFTEVASVLDNQRLNKQALEGWQIMMTNLALDPEGNLREPKGWRNHPAVQMWRGHESALLNYIGAMVYEWKARGYKSTIYDKAERTYEQALRLNLVQDVQPVQLPAWFSNGDLLDSITSSHRLALLCKNYEWYSQFAWDEDLGVAPTTYDYVWVTS